MKNILLESIGYVDAKYLEKAENYMPKKKNTWAKWGAIAACLCILIGGLLPLADKLNVKEPNVPGFAFSAYALDANNKVISSEMVVGESVPISFFESEKGIKGFFFSYPFIENEQNNVPSRIILGDGEFDGYTTEDVIQIALDNSMDMDQNYVVVVFSSDMNLPYDFPYVCTTSDPDVIYQMDMRIDETDEGYNATLLKATKINRVYNPPKEIVFVR